MICKFCGNGIAHYQEVIIINSSEACCMRCEHHLHKDEEPSIVYKEEQTKVY